MDTEKQNGEIISTKNDLSQALHNTGKLPTLRTFQGDVASFIQNKDKTIVDIALKNREEQEKKEKEKAQEIQHPQTTEEKEIIESGYKPSNIFEPIQKPESKAPTILIYALGLLLLVGSAGIGGYLLWIKAKDMPITPENEPTSAIKSENSITLELSTLTETAFSQSVMSARTNPEYKNGVTRFEISESKTRASATANELVQKLGWSIPDTLKRSLTPDFTLGLYNGSGTPEFFAIFKTTDYGIAFRDMLTWEKDMYPDIEPLLLKKDVEQYEWKDVIIKNKDSRALISLSGQIALLYTFINANTILITESGPTMTSLINLFVSSNSIR